MKVLVTGGSGFIGSNLVNKLIKEKHEVVVLDDFLRAWREKIVSKEIGVLFVH